MAALWTERHQPRSEAELVVSKKKVQEVREFLTQGCSAGRRLLVLRGPTGCGKAAVLRALCNDLGFEVCEWSVAVRVGARRTGDASEAPVLFQESLSSTFLRFVAETDRYASLHTEAAVARRPRVTLVRDFPFTLLDNSGFAAGRGNGEFAQRFQDMVRGGAVQRAVFCFNDTTDDHFAMKKLFGPLEYLVITFDVVPRTFAQRALDAAARAEGMDPAAANTAAIAAECGGDLRHGLNALQLAATSARRKGCPKGDATTGSSRGKRGAKGRPPTPQGGASGRPDESSQAVAEPSDMGLRSATLGLFHALGKLLYCKRMPPEGFIPESQPAAKRRRRAGEAEPRQLPPEMLVPKATRPPLYFVPEEVLNASGSEPTKVIDWIFSNAPRYCSDVDDLAQHAATFAEVDAWRSCKEWEPGVLMESPVDVLANSVQVRSFLDANLHPIPPSFADPCGSHGRAEATGPWQTFNMTKPLMLDVQRHRQRRIEDLNSHLEVIGPRALGAGCAGPALCVKTLPFVHLMLAYTMGTHPTLRYLSHAMMQAVKDLSNPIDNPCFVGGDGSTSERGAASGEGGALPASWSCALADDPIEG